MCQGLHYPLELPHMVLWSIHGVVTHFYKWGNWGPDRSYGLESCAITIISLFSAWWWQLLGKWCQWSHWPHSSEALTPFPVKAQQFTAYFIGSQIIKIPGYQLETGGLGRDGIRHWCNSCPLSEGQKSKSPHMGTLPRTWIAQKHDFFNVLQSSGLRNFNPC